MRCSYPEYDPLLAYELWSRFWFESAKILVALVLVCLIALKVDSLREYSNTRALERDNIWMADYGAMSTS